MDSILFLGFAAAYVALLIWGVALLARRRRPVISDLVLLIVLGLVYDNSILGFGTAIGEGAGLEAANAARYWLHALLTPLLVLVAWNVVVRSGARWAARWWVGVVAVLVTAGLMAYEIAVGAASQSLVAETEYGALSYANENAPEGAPVMVLVVAAALLAAGIVVWVRMRWPWLAIVTVIMVIGSAVPVPVPSGAITNAFELILLIGVIATVAFQDTRARQADAPETHAR